MNCPYDKIFGVENGLHEECIECPDAEYKECYQQGLIHRKKRAEEKKPKVHLRDNRLFVNAGMNYPTCQANVELLNLDASHWITTGNLNLVTCKHCLKNKVRSEI
jgi:hypothetical protein